MVSVVDQAVRALLNEEQRKTWDTYRYFEETILGREYVFQGIGEGPLRSDLVARVWRKEGDYFYTRCLSVGSIRDDTISYGNYVLVTILLLTRNGHPLGAMTSGGITKQDLLTELQKTKAK